MTVGREQRKKLLDELKQTKPFDSPAEEAFLQIQRTSDVTLHWVSEVLARVGVSPAQYNVLRILRGAGALGLPTLEVGKRMITRMPDSTRLLQRLEHRGFVIREQDAVNQRIMRARITPLGLQIIEAVTPAVLAQIVHGMNGLEATELDQLCRLLEKVRHGNQAESSAFVAVHESA